MQTVSLSELGNVAREVLKRAASSTSGDEAFFVALSGNLGAGKTTFVQALGRELGVTDAIQSPTYVLMKTYPISPSGGHPFDQLVHIDAYRLEKSEEWETLKPEVFMRNPRALVVLEWPERVGELLLKPNLTLRFSSEGAGPNERYIEVN
jgi:tRNA threonylcarbamoyladenosine biosynthesis protein TsaE